MLTHLQQVGCRREKLISSKKNLEKEELQSTTLTCYSHHSKDATDYSRRAGVHHGNSEQSVKVRGSSMLRSWRGVQSVNSREQAAEPPLSAALEFLLLVLLLKHLHGDSPSGLTFPPTASQARWLNCKKSGSDPAAGILLWAMSSSGPCWALLVFSGGV